ncbi:MAG TPA: glycosyltransferase family 39 protein, partial [Chloroflexota bacterium]|nr:glycosyltransferase family 39 protein [Chloroflexota bacterium]
MGPLAPAGILRAALAHPAAQATAIALASVALRAPFLSVPLITDEGGYGYVAHWLGRGLALYRDLWFDRPQAIFLLYRIQMHLLGESTEAIRLGAALYNAATALVVFALGSALGGRRAGGVAAGGFAVWSAAPALEGFTANGELYMALPVVLSILAAVRRRWLLSGVAAGLACMVKPTAALSLGPALAVLLAWRPAALQPALRCAMGGACAVGPFVAHGLLTDAAQYWYSVVGFRVSAHSAFSVGEALLADLRQTAPTALAAGAPLWALAALGVAKSWRTRQGAAITALLAGAIAGAAAGGYWYWHYYAGLVPGAALAAGMACARQGSPWGSRRA